MRRILAAGAVLVLTLSSVGAPVARVLAADGEPSDGTRNPEQAMADAIAFRTEFGFASDEATISQLLADKSADMSFGAPLTTDELANMNLRQAQRDAAEPAVQYVMSHAEDFGGVYFTQSTGRLVLVILPVKSPTSGVAEQARALSPEGLNTEARAVDHSMNELLAAQRRLMDRRKEFRINEIGLDVIGNGLEIVFEPDANTDAALEVAGVPVAVSFGPGPTAAATCTNASSCTPYRGGIGIFSPQANEFCTWGFYGSRGTSSKYIITAGHCAAVTDTETHLGVVFTDGVDRNTFQMVDRNQFSDSLTAHVKGSANAVSPFNTIYASGTDKAHAITSQRHTSSQQPGDAVCFMGAHTGTSLCGSIEAINLSYDLTRFDGRTITLFGQIRMSRVTVIGDSGGPVYQGPVAYGVLNALNGGNAHMLYSTIENVEADMGNTIICLTAAC